MKLAIEIHSSNETHTKRVILPDPIYLSKLQEKQFLDLCEKSGGVREALAKIVSRGLSSLSQEIEAKKERDQERAEGRCGNDDCDDCYPK